MLPTAIINFFQSQIIKMQYQVLMRNFQFQLGKLVFRHTAHKIANNVARMIELYGSMH